MRQHKLWWQSSYDRGLQHTLKMWPRIKEIYPDATFDICYGWDLFIKNYANNPERLKWMEKMKELMKQPGIQEHGRIGQDKMKELRSQCGIWFYPTDFEETNCAVKDTPIFTKSGVKSIQDVVVGDMVLTHTGKWQKVSKVMSRFVNENVYGLKVKKTPYPIYFTGEHPILVNTYNRRSDSVGKRVYNKKNIKTNWVEVKDVVPMSNYVVSPKIIFGSKTELAITDYIDWKVKDGYLYSKGGVKNKWSNNIKLTDEFMYMLGLFCADGSATRVEKRNVFGQIQFAFNSNQVSIIDRIKRVLPIKIVQTSDNGSMGRFNCSPFSAFLNKICYVNKSKIIPEFVWDTSVELQKSFLNGILDGDGCRYKGSVVFSNTSRSLAYGVNQLLVNIGISPSMNYSKIRKAYTLQWKYESTKSHIVDNGDSLSRRITGLEISKYKGNVYNLEVENDNSYVVANFVVHNCIGALECQEDGVVPCVINKAGLRDTVGSGVAVEGEIWDVDVREEYFKQLIDLMGDEKRWKAEQIKGKEFVKKFYREEIAKQWITQF